MKDLLITQAYTYKLSDGGKAKIFELFQESGFSFYEIETKLCLKEEQFKRWLSQETGLVMCFIVRLGELLGFDVKENNIGVRLENQNQVREIFSKVD